MKQLLIDLLLAILLICMISIFFDDHYVSKTMFDRSLEDFEEKIEMNENIKSDYVVLQDTSDNHVSSLFKTMSDGCVKFIQYIVLIFSDFISMIFSVMVY